MRAYIPPVNVRFFFPNDLNHFQHAVLLCVEVYTSYCLSYLSHVLVFLVFLAYFLSDRDCD
jgi:hypothetical protein